MNWFPLNKYEHDIETTKERVNNLMTATKVAKFTFVDVSTNWNDPALNDVFDKATDIWLVVKPVASKVKGSLIKFKERMGRWSDKVKFVGNMFDGYARGKDIVSHLDYLITTPPEFLEDEDRVLNSNSRDYYVWRDASLEIILSRFQEDLVSKAEWNSEVFARSEEGQELAAQGMLALVNLLAPGTVLSERKRKGLKSLFKKAN